MGSVIDSLVEEGHLSLIGVKGNIFTGMKTEVDIKVYKS